jgi:Uma2 family endonuclease
MAMLTLQLPAHDKQRAFNLRRWAELLADRQLARIEARIETDRFGRIIMSPPPAPAHGTFQAEIARLLGNLTTEARVLTECPISTADGVKAADVAWAAPECLRKLGKKLCFPCAPEICVEVLSRSNTEREIREKTRLYFDAGAKEVWICGLDAAMTFLVPTAPRPPRRSPLCARFPSRLKLR